MPFVSVDHKKLEKSLSLCSQISTKKSEVDLFTLCKVIIDSQHLTLQAINNSLYGETKIPITNPDLGGQEKVEFLINTELFAGSNGVLIDEQITLDIDLDKHILILQGAKAKHTLRIQTDMLEDFKIPKPSKQPITSITLNIQEFLRATKIASQSVGLPKNVYQSEFLHICLNLDPSEKKLEVVATDRYRIAKTCLVANYTGADEAKIAENSKFLILPKNLNLANSILDSESFEMLLDNDHLWVKGDTDTLILNYGEGKYPDYNKIIPQSFGCTFNLKNQDLLQAIKQVYLLARTNTINKSITLKVQPAAGKLTLSSQNKDGFASQSTVLLENYEGVQEEWEQAFNADYLLDFVNFLGDKTLSWEANPGKPSVLSELGKKNDQLYLVSGLR